VEDTPRPHQGPIDLSADEAFAPNDVIETPGLFTMNMVDVLPEQPEVRPSSQAVVETRVPGLYNSIQQEDCQLQQESGDGSGKVSSINAMGSAIPGAARPSTRHREFYGESSLMSLVQQISPSSTQRADQHTVPPRDVRNRTPHGSGEFTRTHGRRINQMLEAQYSLPPRSIADHLLSQYRDNCHIFYPWVHWPSFSKEVERLWTGQEQNAENPVAKPDIGLGGGCCPAPVMFCALNAILATSCQLGDMATDEREPVSSLFYNRAKELLHVEICESGSMSHVQALLLVGHYLLCTQYPTQCWNVVGLACRMAIGLGLQSGEVVEGQSMIETEMRRRVWYGCLQMDM